MITALQAIEMQEKCDRNKKRKSVVPESLKQSIREVERGEIVEFKEPKKRRMNKTETEYANILESMKVAGSIVGYRFEGISLLWGGGMRYKADFAVFKYSPPITLVEVKGAHIWSRDRVRFKGCREEWKQWFNFEMHQKSQGRWTRIL